MDTHKPTSQFELLAAERQLTIDGREEPPVALVAAEPQEGASEADTRTLDLFTWRNVLDLFGGPRDGAARSAGVLRKFARLMQAKRPDQTLILNGGASNLVASQPAKRARKNRDRISTRKVVKCREIEAKCRCHAGHQQTVVFGCCRRRCMGIFCRSKHGAERRRRAAAAWEAFDKGRPTPVLNTVLGLHPDCREALRDPEIWSAVWRCADVLVEQWLLGLNGLDKKGTRLGTVAVTHPEGDRKPTELQELPDFAVGKPGEWLPHWNGQTVGIACRGRERYELRYYHRSDDRQFAAPLRAAWAFIQGIIRGSPLKTEADVWYGFASSEEKRQHSARYFNRTFPGWEARSQRIRWTGFLAPNFKQRPHELARAEAEAEEEIEELHKGRACPVAGCNAPTWIDEGRIPLEWRRADQYLTRRQREAIERRRAQKARATGPPP